MGGERSLVFPSESLLFVFNVLMINWDSFILIDNLVSSVEYYIIIINIIPVNILLI